MSERKERVYKKYLYLFTLNKNKKKIKETSEIIIGRDSQGRKTINQYILLDKLGQGSFGKVKLAIKNDTKEKFAVKIFRKSLLKKKRCWIKTEAGIKLKDALQDVMKEIEIMKKLNHKNVVKMHEIINDPKKDRLFLILDFVSKGQLIDWDEEKRKFFFCHDHPDEFLSEVFLRKIFRDLVKGLNYLHNNDILHRDLKPQNILFDDLNNAKITDFSVALTLSSLFDSVPIAGTSYFFPPELIQVANSKNNGFQLGNNLKSETNFDIEKKYDSSRKIDIWSLGLCFFVFTFKEIPFHSIKEDDLMKEICEEKKIELEGKREVSNGLKDLIGKMLEKDSEKRIGLRGIIEHDWINQGSKPLRQEIDEENFIPLTKIHKTLIPKNTMIFLKKIARRWCESSSSRSKILWTNSEGSSPYNTPLTFDIKNVKKSKFSQLNETKKTLIFCDNYEEKKIDIKVI